MKVVVVMVVDIVVVVDVVDEHTPNMTSEGHVAHVQLIKSGSEHIPAQF